MDRRAFIGASSTLVAGLSAGCTSAEQAASSVAGPATAPPQMPERIIIDALGGIGNPNLGLQSSGLGEDAGSPQSIDARALSDAKKSGMTAFNVTLGYVAGPKEPFEFSINEIAWWDARIEANSEHLLKVRSTADILQAHNSGRLGVIYGFQNATMMGDDAHRVTTFARLGVRIIQLTYNVANQLGDGSMVPENRGLSEFGRDVVTQLNADNLLVDLSHSGEQTCLDAIAASNGPIAITHSGCRALADLPRNKSDEELRLLADNGGVVGIYFMPFLKVGAQPYAEDVV
jgi:membrane dipeptidase